MIESGPAIDLAALATLRAVMMDADNRADARAFIDAMADDVVIMAPGLPVLVGHEPCASFVTGVLAEYPQRRLEEMIAEVHVSGDLAFDRGSFVTEVFDAELGQHVRECGTALRIYRRTSGGWKLARVMWYAEDAAGASQWGGSREAAKALPSAAAQQYEVRGEGHLERLQRLHARRVTGTYAAVGSAQ